jgi:prolyl 4-hydroxylase
MTSPTELALHDFPDSSFVHGCYIPHQVCDDLINYFIDNPERHLRGEVYGTGDKSHELIVDNNVKASTDINFFDETDRIILEDYVQYLDLCIKEYEYKYHHASLMAWYGPTESVNLQKYEPGEGFKAWHCERAGIPNQTRCLAFMTYLNDVSDGGTEFLYQQITTPAKKGLTIIWPSDWTHTHRGQISYTQKKYIMTGWLNYKA